MFSTPLARFIGTTFRHEARSRSQCSRRSSRSVFSLAFCSGDPAISGWWQSSTASVMPISSGASPQRAERWLGLGAKAKLTTQELFRFLASACEALRSRAVVLAIKDIGYVSALQREIVTRTGDTQLGTVTSRSDNRRAKSSERH